METIPSATTPGALPARYPQPGAGASQTRLAAVSGSRSLDLNLVTAEGDKVTLSMDTVASAVYAAHGEVQADADTAAVSWGEFSGGQVEREVTLSVEGDLNRAERREIRKVISTINRMMNDFVEGRVKPMVNKASKLTGLENIVSLDLSMSYERIVVVAGQTEMVAGYDPSGAALPEPAPAGQAYMAADPRPSLEIESRSLAEKMARETAAARAPADSLRKAAHRLLKAYRRMAHQWNPLGGRILDRVHDLFAAALDARAGFAPEHPAADDRA